MAFATIFTPQGDGNAKVSPLRTELVAAICHDIYPARGRKLKGSLKNFEFLCQKICHDIYPARGRKPKAIAVISSGWRICHDIYPARGRKLRKEPSLRMAVYPICHDIYPARGRKLMVKGFVCAWYLEFATIFTPQGDGNSFSLETLFPFCRYLPRYLPRKGTETIKYCGGDLHHRAICHDIYPARGRKLGAIQSCNTKDSA